jgi:hypothetical protein
MFYARHGVHRVHAKVLLKAIADKLIPGLPDNLRILLVSQVNDEDDGFLFAGDEEKTLRDPELTVTEHVVMSDRRRERAMAEQQRLSIYMYLQILSHTSQFHSPLQGLRVLLFFCNSGSCVLDSSVQGKTRP